VLKKDQGKLIKNSLKKNTSLTLKDSNSHMSKGLQHTEEATGVDFLEEEAEDTLPMDLHLSNKVRLQLIPTQFTKHQCSYLKTK
jgi:hypothetical protein